MWEGKLSEHVFKDDGVETFLEERASDPKLVLPTHLVRLNGKSPAPQETILNIYDGTWREDFATNRAFDRLWTEILRLRSSMSRDLARGHYTHIVLLSMGWNTQQDETILNARDIIRESRLAAKAEGIRFEPLVVTVSWHSFWDLGLLGKSLGSFPGRFSLKDKGNDADEIAQTWIQHVLREVLVPLKHRYNVPLVMIGHSLGGRLVTTAAASGWTVDAKSSAADIDLVLALEGAFPVLRFTEAHLGVPFAKTNRSKRLVFDNYNNGARAFVCTGSAKDESCKLSPITGLFTDGSPYALNPTGLDELESKAHFQRGGRLEPSNLKRAAALLPARDPKRPGVIVDATAFIDSKAPSEKTPSGRDVAKLSKDQHDNKADVTQRVGKVSPHSDIYDAEVGQFIAGCIKRYAR